MRRLLLVVVAAAAALAVPGVARAIPRGETHGFPARPLLPTAQAIGQCGVPSEKPLWIDTAAPELEHVFARSGLVLAVSSGDFPSRARQLGANTVHIDLYLNRRVGTPTAPADAGVITDRANKLFDYAAAQSGCDKPLIAVNELFGAHLETPWTATNERYRRNVLVYLKALADRGARPFLLLSTLPFTDGDAGDWWREAAKYADLVPEVYFNGPRIFKDGVVLGNRRLRVAMRRAVMRLRTVGIPAERIGVMLGFQTGRGAGGREGLEPDSAWYQVVKWQALAARQVAAETGIATVWSWGWPSYGTAAALEDKEGAACVYLWTRDRALCDAPGLVGEDLDTDLEAGQLLVPKGRACMLGKRGLDEAAIAALQRLTGDREVAFTALLARTAESPYGPVPTVDALAAERAVIQLSFGGSGAAYRAALAKAGATVGIARAILGDELRRLQLESKMRARSPSAGEVSAFYFSYPELLARAVRARPAPWWLGGREQGLALEPLAPPQLFAMPQGPRTLRALDGTYEVDVLGDVRSLGSIPFPDARGAIAAALRAFARRAAFESWTVARQEAALKTALCKGDDLPISGTVRLSSYLPFLSLGG